jgi:hypothetical protein
MKEKYTVTNCEYCGKQISLKSPPSDEQYENAQIYIQDGGLLLPKAVVKRNHKRGVTEDHSKSLAGYYCKPVCLSAHIHDILYPK